MADLLNSRPLIAAHRGTSGANIIQNTIAAYENALLHGADIIEVDVIQTIDGEFFVFHNGQEPGLVGVNRDIRTMTAREVRELRFINGMQERVSEPVNSLEDVLEHFKGRCLINVDRSWFYWKEVISFLKRHNMDDQIILKSHGSREELEILQDSESKLMYLPIARAEETILLAENYQVNLWGAEVIFETEEHVFAGDAFIQNMHQKGRKLWVNAITLNDTTKLTAGHDDNTAILESMDKGWGWLMDKGYDIIQTDWPLRMRNYMEKR